MGMSAKAKALLTGEKGAEWQKYQLSMQQAYNDFQEEQAKVQTKQTSKSGWSKLLGGIAFAATALVLSSNPVGWGVIASGLGGAGVGALASWGAHEAQKDVTLGKTKEQFMADIYDPKFGVGQAELEKSKLGSDIDIDVSALEAYEEGGLESALFENVGRSSSYISTRA